MQSSIIAKMTANRLPLVVAIGDPSGIGPEIISKAWAARDTARLAPFFAVGDVRSIGAVWSGPTVRIDDPREAAGHFGRALPVMQVEDAGDITPGVPNFEGARCALAALVPRGRWLPGRYRKHSFIRSASRIPAKPNSLPSGAASPKTIR
jgi:hypothetical protein